MTKYLTDVKYPSDFVISQSVTRFNYVRSIKSGQSHYCTESFRYCDLACGNGVTLLFLAALYPEANFIGVDINSSHIQEANSIKTACQIHNVDFIEADLAELNTSELQGFDYIAIAGAYSWLSGTARSSLHDFVDRKLNRNGLFFIHYASLPGRVAIGPLWRLMQEYTKSIEGSKQRAEEAVKLVTTMKQFNAGFFEQYPVARSRLKGFKNQSLEYIAHECLNESWKAHYHFDIVEEMKKLGLRYIGNSQLRRNYPELLVPNAYTDLLQSAPDKTVSESLLDYINPDVSRMDIYSKCCSSGEESNIGGVVFGVDLNIDSIKESVTFSDGAEFSLKNEKMQRIFLLLSEKPRTLADLMEDSMLGKDDVIDVSRGVEMLVAVGQIVPFKQTANVLRNDTSSIIKIRIPLMLNAYMLSPDNWKKGYIFLASPVSGYGHRVSWLQAVILYALTLDSEGSVWERVSRVLKLDNVVNTKPDNFNLTLEQIEKQLPNFLGRRLAKFIQLGIAEE